MKVTAFGLTDVGLQREHNEDSFQLLDEFQLYIVADGMGGHRAGDVASQMATEAIASFFRATQSEDTTWPFHFDPTLTVDENRLATSIKVANRKIFEASHRNREVRGMGTTVVSAVFSKRRPRIYIAHVGDSRCYRIRDGHITQLTRDHSLLNDYLMFMPDMTPERQDEIPKNVITRALGMQDTVVVDLLSEKVQEGDVFVLCSDGLSGMVTDEDIVRVWKESGNDLEAAGKALIAAANAGGGDDNVSVVLLRAEGVPTDDPDEEVRRGRDIGTATTLEMNVGQAKTLEIEARDVPDEITYLREKEKLAREGVATKPPVESKPPPGESKPPPGKKRGGGRRSTPPGPKRKKS